jgi:uncharacterized protein
MTRPFSLLIKPAGPDCNIACRYCFYTCKSEYFGPGAHRMSPEILDRLIKSYLAVGLPQSSFAWQGGEPTLMGLDFYKRAVELQRQYGQPGQAVSNTLQTNAILLDDDWCRFLADYKFLVGISLDGPREMHDAFRCDRAGKGTFDRVMAAIDRCREHKTEYNILTLLSSRNVDHPDELFDFFTTSGFCWLQFIPCVEPDPRDPARPAPFSITAEQYGRFLCRFFDRWYNGWTRKLSVRTFDSMLSHLLGRPYTECTFNTRCGDYMVVEHNGDAFCCDFHVEDRTRLGNIMETPMPGLMNSETMRRFAWSKSEIADPCLICRYLPFCRGGCPKDRRVLAGSPRNPNWFCEAYRMFLDHCLGRLRSLAIQAQNPHPPAKRPRRRRPL